MFGRGQYRHKDRYPDPPAPPAEWWGWRRRKGETGPWQRVEDATALTQGTCYQRLTHLSELVGTDGPVEWVYFITPAGERPPAFDGPGRRGR